VFLWRIKAVISIEHKKEREVIGLYGRNSGRLGFVWSWWDWLLLLAVWRRTIKKMKLIGRFILWM
jgi:hypothetical protein